MALVKISLLIFGIFLKLIYHLAWAPRLVNLRLAKFGSSA